MKIAIISSTFPPYAGGIGNVAAANAKVLALQGHDVTVLTPSYDQATKEVTDINVKHVPVFLAYGNAAWCPSLGRQLKGFDIIHLHYPFFGGAESIWLHQRKLKRHGAKIILHYHMDVVGKGIFKLIFSVHKKIILPRIIKMADKVIVTSKDYAQQSFLKKFMTSRPDDFIEIPNGVDVTKFIPQEKNQAIMQKHGFNQADKIVLFVGGLDKAHYFKGIEYLIEALSRLRSNDSYKLVIVGSGDLKDHYANLARKLKIEKQVVFTGHVSDDELPAYYNLANVSVLPSIDKSEAFGLALVEAMSCAKPVIASNLPGVRSVVDDKINGLLVRPKDSQDLSEKIDYILTHENKAIQFGQAGRSKVEKEYDWQMIGQKINRLYNES